MKKTNPFYRPLIAIYNIYEFFINQSSGNLFCFLFNIKATLRKWSVRFAYDQSDSGLYTVKDGSNILKFGHERIGNGSYSKGLDDRADKIGAAYLLQKIVFKDNDVIVDCGANVGDLKLYFHKKKLEIEYIGIEPSPLEYRCLHSNIYPSISMNIGLWNEDTKLDFYVSSIGADSSIVRPEFFDETISINALRLDSINVPLPIKLLKIEAEGCEPEVLMGCEGILEKIHYISADLGFERGVNKESTLIPAINFLLRNNFIILGINYERFCVLFKNQSFDG